jgi:hypothetical protein
MQAVAAEFSGYAGNSAAFLESKVSNSLFRSIHSKGALKLTRSVCLRAF